MLAREAPVSEPDVFEATALHYEEAAAELEVAAKHLRITASHHRARNVPRGCAHAWAATGHVLNAQELLEQHAMLHATKVSAE